MRLWVGRYTKLYSRHLLPTYCTFDQLDTGCGSVQNSKKQTRSAHSTVVLASSKLIVIGECIKGRQSLVHIASHQFLLGE